MRVWRWWPRWIGCWVFPRHWMVPWDRSSPAAAGCPRVGCCCRWPVRTGPVRISWSGWTTAARTPPGSSWNRCRRRRRRPPRSWRSVSPQHMWPGSRTGLGWSTPGCLALVSPRRRAQLLAAATIDGDTTDVEVYGRDKQDAVYNYQGQRAYRPHIAFWAEGGVTLAADLMKADEDP